MGCIQAYEKEVKMCFQKISRTAFIASVALFLGVLGVSSQTLADGEPEEFASCAEVREKLIKQCNPDLSHKFKQKALNYILGSTTRAGNNCFMIVTKDAIYYTTSYGHSLEQCPELGCEILLDEVDKTILKCPWGSWAPGKFDIYVFEERGYIKATKKRYSSIEEYEKNGSHSLDYIGAPELGDACLLNPKE